MQGRLHVCTFGNKGARPAQRRGATGCGVAAKKGLGLVHEEALALLQRGGLHGQEGGILKFRVGAGDGAWAKWAGAHWESQFVCVQLWEGTTKGMCLSIYLKVTEKEKEIKMFSEAFLSHLTFYKSSH